jgi:tetratricopeptide (TPR) repeat protein
MAGATEDWKQAKSKGNQAYQAGNHLLAVEHFTTAIQLTPKDGDHQLHILYSNRSAARLNLGLAYEALADAKKCTEIQPAFAKGWSRVGAAMYRMGRYPEAVAAYTEGLVQAPGNAVRAPIWRGMTSALRSGWRAARTSQMSLSHLAPVPLPPKQAHMHSRDSHLIFASPYCLFLSILTGMKAMYGVTSRTLPPGPAPLIALVCFSPHFPPVWQRFYACALHFTRISLGRSPRLAMLPRICGALLSETSCPICELSSSRIGWPLDFSFPASSFYSTALSI